MATRQGWPQGCPFWDRTIPGIDFLVECGVAFLQDVLESLLTQLEGYFYCTQVN